MNIGMYIDIYWYTTKLKSQHWDAAKILKPLISGLKKTNIPMLLILGLKIEALETTMALTLPFRIE